MGPWFRLPSASPRAALMFGLLLTPVSFQAVSAQTSPTPTDQDGQAQETGSLNMACWQGAPRPTCGGFVIVEMQGVLPLAQSQRGQTGSGLETFDSQLEWNVGYLGNVGNRWAVGATVSLGTGAGGVLTGLRARARRWLGPQHSLELEGGMLRTQAMFQPGDLTGVTAGVRFNVADRGSLFVRWGRAFAWANLL